MANSQIQINHLDNSNQENSNSIKSSMSEIIETIKRGYVKELGDLYQLDLSKVHLVGACLSETTMIGVNLFGADLCGAGLRGAFLSRANLCQANLAGTDLDDARLEVEYYNI